MNVLTYNIRGGLGMDGRRATERIAEVIRASEAEVVCLQEVHQRLPWSGWVDQPGRLQRSLGLRGAFQANVPWLWGGYGLMILTRFPVLEVRRHFLPSVGERRGALEVICDAPRGPLAVFCTHWGLRSEERLRQADALVSVIRQTKTPVIVCGDLNERADAPAARRLQAETGLYDACPQGEPTYPSDAPSARIDFIFHSPALIVRSARTLPTLASDHLPVCVEIGD